MDKSDTCMYMQLCMVERVDGWMNG